MLTNWIPWRWIIKKAATSYGFIDPISLLARLRRFSQPSEFQEPLELLRAGLVFHARGLINAKSIQQNLDWIWPYWVERQFNPSDPSFLPRSFSFSQVNLTQRNWTAVGTPSRNAYPLVDPRGLITPFFDGWSLDFWFIPADEDAPALFPSKMDRAEQGQQVDSHLRVTTRLDNEAAKLTLTAWVDDAGSSPMLFIKSQAAARQAGRLVVSVRPYNSEGIHFIEKIKVLAEAPGLQINGHTPLYFNQVPEKIIFSDYTEGDVIHQLEQSGHDTVMRCNVGMATAAVLFPSAPAETSVEVETRISLDDVPPDAVPAPRRETLTWESAHAAAPQLRIPDEGISSLYDTALNTLLLLSADDVVPGPFTYKRFWFRDACFMIQALLTAGYTDRCQRLLNTFLERQKATGYFQSQEGEWDSNGQVLWIMDRFQRLTGRPLDDTWLNALKKAGHWIIRKRLPEKGGRLHDGLLPAGFSAEHLGPNDYYYWDSFWGVAGLRAAAAIMKRAGDTREHRRFARAAEAFQAAVDKSIAGIPDKRKRDAIPASPYRRMDAGAVGSLVADYPLDLYPAGHPAINNTVEILMAQCFQQGGFFQDMIHSGINPYLTLCIAQSLLRNGDLRFRELIRTVAGLASPTGHWPEAIHPLTGGGCMGDGQHGWAAAEWVMMLHNSFVREEGDHLIIGSGIWPEWLTDSADIRFGPILTSLGMIRLRLESRKDQALLNLSLPHPDRSRTLVAQIPGFAPVTIDNPGEPIRLTPA